MVKYSIIFASMVALVAASPMDVGAVAGAVSGGVKTGKKIGHGVAEMREKAKEKAASKTSAAIERYCTGAPDAGGNGTAPMTVTVTVSTLR